MPRRPSSLPAHIRRHGRGYQVRVTIDGIQRSSRVYADIGDAIRWRDVALRDGARLAESDHTLREALAATLARTDSSETRRFLRCHMKAVHLHLPAAISLDDVTVPRVEAMRDSWRGAVSAQTIRHRLDVLRRVMSTAIADGWHLGANPASSSAVPRPRVRRPPIEWFAEAELGELLDRIVGAGRRDSDRMVAWVSVLASTGLRRTELARARVRHINAVARSWWVDGKSGDRTVPYGTAVAPQVEWMLEHARGDRLSPGPSGISAKFREWRILLGERRLRPHVLRHTYATALIRAGVDVETVRTLLGHRTLAMTLRYLHVAGSTVREAAESLRLAPRDRRTARRSRRARGSTA